MDKITFLENEIEALKLEVAEIKKLLSGQELQPKKGIASITPEVITRVAGMYQVSEKDVTDIFTDLKLYVKGKGKRYSNYEATLQTWVRRKLKDGSIRKVKSEALSDYVTGGKPEVYDENKAKLATEIRKNLYEKLSSG
jgi:hypothetical protein